MSSFFVDTMKDAMEHPVTGVVVDPHSKKYLMAPDYWNYWGGPTKPFSPASNSLWVNSPPATWWEQRTEWRDTWNRLSSGEDQPARWPLKGKPNLTEKERCMPVPGLLKEPADKPNLWWQWLEKPKGGNPGASLLDAAKAEAKAATGLTGDSYQTECPTGIELKEPVVEHWGEPTKLEEEGKRVDEELEHPATEDAEGGAPGAEGSAAPAGGAGGAQHGEKMFDPSSPPPVAPEQEAWLRAHTFRRQTLPGYPRPLLPDGLRGATPRISRFDTTNQPATMDPRLLDPPLPPNKRLYAPDKIRKEMTVKIYDGKLKGGGLMKMLGDKLQDATMGGTTLEYRALARVLQSEPDFFKRYLNGEIFNLLHGDLYGEPIPTVNPTGLDAHAPAEPSISPAEPARWVPPRRPSFEEGYRANWDRFWSQLGHDVHANGEPESARGTAASLRRAWQGPSGAPHREPAELIRGIAREIGAARGAAAFLTA